MRVAVYTRISTDEDHQPYSLEAQTERLNAFIRSQDGWELARRYTDEMSGSKLERPGLQKALTDARLHRFDVLLVYRVDRLSRSVRGLAQILEELDQAGVHFRSATEPFDTGAPAGRMMVQMLGVFAEFERATLIDRVIAGMERKAAHGGWLGGLVPFGYEIDSATSTLKPRADEAAVVPVIFELCTNGQLGSRAIAMSLNARGQRTRTGRLWSHKAVLQILRNHVYAGEVRFRGLTHPATHDPLIDKDTFEACQAILDARGEDHSHRRSYATDYLLAGLVHCEHCGKRFIGTSAHGKLYRYRYYTCFSRHRYGRVACQADRLPAERLDQAVVDSLLGTLANTNLIEQALREAEAQIGQLRPRLDEELASVDARIKKTAETIERYLVAFESRTMPESVCAPRLESLDGQMRDLRMRRSEIVQASDSNPQPKIALGELQDLRDAVQAALESGSVPQQKAFLKALVAEVRVDNRGAIHPVFRIPYGGVRVLGQVVGREGVEPPQLSRRFYRPLSSATCSVPTQPSAGGQEPTRPGASH